MSNYQESTEIRTQQLNDKIYSRNIPSTEMMPNVSTRGVSTKYSTLPIIDRHRFPKEEFKKFESYQVSNVFNPGNDGAPWNGFASNVNLESILRNQFFALQKSDRAYYVPDSSSELFNAPEISSKVDTDLLVFKNEPVINFDPNPLNLGKETFNNFTRYQLKNLSL